MENGVRRGKFVINFKDVAILSIALYIIIAICYDGTGLSKLSLASYGIYLCVAVCAFYALLIGKFYLQTVYIFMLLFGAVLSISTIYSPASESLKNMYLYRFWTGVILMFLVCNTVSTREDIDKLLHAIIIGSVLLSLNIYVQFGFSNIADAEERILDGVGDINMLGVYCAFAIIIATIFIFTKKKHRLWYFLSIVVAVPFLMFTGSRKAVLLVVVGLLTFVFSYSQNRGLIKRLIGILVILAVGIFLIETIPAFAVIRAHFEDMLNLFSGEGEMDQGDLNRIEYIEYGWQYFKQKPLVGNGFFSSFFYLGAYTHCNFVELLMNNGLIGFCVYYFVRLYVLGRAIKSGTRNDVLTGLVITFSIALLFCDIGVVTYYNRFLFVITAICSRAADILNKEKKTTWLGNK